MENQNNQITLNKPDPIVLYLIINSELNMTAGKLVAQTAHGTQMILQQLYSISAFPEYRETYSDEEAMRLSLFEEWLKTDYRKVSLRADSKEWEKIKVEMKDNMALVIDKGLTQIPEGSETCIALFPMKKSERPKIIKRLQVLE